ncbi:MAG: hypothetical protein U1E59_10515 [Amaricoccus sp.]
MRDVDITETGLTCAAERFPEAVATMRRLVETDRQFREICEEYGLARQSLAGFEARADAANRPEIGDYRTLIVELEQEIGRFLKAAGPLGPGRP